MISDLLLNNLAGEEEQAGEGREDVLVTVAARNGAHEGSIYHSLYFCVCLKTALIKSFEQKKLAHLIEFSRPH